MATVAAVIIGAVVAVLVAAGVWLFFIAPQVDVTPGKTVRVRVASGSSTRDIANKLLDAGVIANPNGFALHSRLVGADGRMQPGTYELTTGMSNADAIAVLETGPLLDLISVTIPEGFRVDQVAERLERVAGIPKKEFLALAEHEAPRFAERHPALAGVYKGSLEGYLFPKTYRLKPGTTAEQAIEIMLSQFDEETASLDYSYAESRGLTRAQVVTMASMIERESRLDSERPKVASVIYNRLDRDMRLKIDATIEYVLREKRLRLTNADLYTKTPYNTYLHKGLPPGPISSPGIASLQAATAPAQTDFIYYVLTGKDGSHTFTTNLADFLVAKKKSKEVFGR
ncbi:MAG: endolytic transglycosylase MltG [Coriobacteriia bacterium]|nr:endolytic transglycosylase MltG [Coriobacteriia bacterium]